jgi:hypothetical protein
VLAALEVLRTLHEHDVHTDSPIALIDWTNEEGARFGGAMMASGVWSTKSDTDLGACHLIKDPEHITLIHALEDIGFLGTTPCDYRENGLACHFELHIEQGPTLEQEDKSIGVVTAVQGMKWFRVRVSGLEGHAGEFEKPTTYPASSHCNREANADFEGHNPCIPAPMPLLPRHVLLPPFEIPLSKHGSE